MSKFSQQHRGFTLVEAMLVTGLTAIVLAAIAPHFYAIHRSWQTSERKLSQTQNGRVAIQLMTRELRQAMRLVSVTSAGNNNGAIVYTDPAGNQKAFGKVVSNGQPYLALTQNGSPSIVAGPITNLTFQPIREDAVSPALSVSTTRRINVSVTIQDPSGNISDNPFTTAITLRKSFIGAFYYGCFAGHDLNLAGIGWVQGSIHANHRTSKGFLIFLSNGTITDANQGISVTVPTYNVNHYLVPYQNIQSYLALADVVITGNFTFQTGQTYSGIYYVSNTGTVTVGNNVTLNGSLISEGSLSIAGDRMTIAPSGTSPAIITEQGLSILGRYFSSTGTIYGRTSLSIDGDNAQCQASTGARVAVGSNGNIALDSRSITIVGSTISGGALTVHADANATFTGDDSHAAIIANNITVTGQGATISGAVISGNDATFGNLWTTLNGSVLAARDVTMRGILFITYAPGQLSTPPMYVREL